MEWALNYATKNGLEILAANGERITIPARKVATMFAPDAQAFAALFLARVGAGDVILSPSGPNYTYLPGASARGAAVYWIHPAKTEGVAKVATHLLKRFREHPEDFYAFEPQDERIAVLGTATRMWIGLERDRAGNENAYGQLLRREGDFFALHQPDRAGWVARMTQTERRKVLAQLKKRGVELTKDQRTALDSKTTAHMEALYDSYFGDADDAKASKKAKEDLIRMRLEWFGVSELEDHHAAEVRRLLTDTPENALFDGLVSDGAVKTRAEVLTFMRNPRFYPTAGHLRVYAGLGLKDGQAIARRRGEAARGNPDFRRALCFDFAEKYWQNDPIGFFAALYYAYKEHQYRKYWDLLVLTTDVYEALGHAGGDEEDAEPANGNGTKADAGTIHALAERLYALRNLDLIRRSTPMQQAVDALFANPTPALLRKIFLRSPTIGGMNLQMTPKRIERQTKRRLGSVLLDAIYYRWLTQLGAPLPLAEDFIFTRMWREVTGSAGVPESYDHEVVLRFYRGRNAAMAAERRLPDEVEAKFLPPDERRKQAAEKAVSEAAA